MTTKNIALGSIVLAHTGVGNNDLRGQSGKVVGHLGGIGSGVYLVAFGSDVDGHNGNSLTDVDLMDGYVPTSDNHWYVADAHLEVTTDPAPETVAMDDFDARRGVLAEALASVMTAYRAGTLEDGDRMHHILAEICAGIEQLGADGERAAQKVKAAPKRRAKSVPSVPQEPSAPMTKAVLELLRKKGSITAIEAAGVLRCRALPRRIADLKELGWSIVREVKEDPTGQRYARYHLLPTTA